MTIYCNNPQCRGVLNERTPARCPECGIPTGATQRERINLRGLQGVSPKSTPQNPTKTAPSQQASTAPTPTSALASTPTPPPTPTPPTPTPTFTTAQLITAINAWLQFGQDSFNNGQHDGYFCNNGHAAQALRAAREFIQANHGRHAAR